MGFSVPKTMFTFLEVALVLDEESASSATGTA
jgi:hypothetical protein